MSVRDGGWERRFATLAALVGVNTVGISGQAMWAYTSLGRSIVLAGGFALVLESVALYLTAQASAAMLANDEAGALRLGAYAFGILTGAMNYAAHCGPHYAPTALAMAFGLLSALSPWLWAIHSRRVHRDQLHRDGLIDPRTVKIPTALWLRRPGYSWALWSLGVTNGVNHLPTLRRMLAETQYLRELDPADAVGYAFGVVGSDEHAARVWLAERSLRVTQATLDQATAARASVSGRDMTARGGSAEAGSGTQRQRGDGSRGVAAKTATTAQRVAAAWRQLPDATVAEVARRAEVGVRTAYRHLATIEGRTRSATVSRATEQSPEPLNGHAVPVRYDTVPSTSGQTSWQVSGARAEAILP